MSNIAQQAGEMLQENDELEEDEATPSRFERLDSKQRRIHDGSQMRIRLFKHTKLMQYVLLLCTNCLNVEV